MKILLLALAAVATEPLQPGVQIELTPEEAEELTDFRQTRFTLTPGEVDHLTKYRKEQAELEAKREAETRERNSKTFIQHGKELITSTWFQLVAAFCLLFVAPGPWLWRKVSDWWLDWSLLYFRRLSDARSTRDDYRRALEDIVEAGETEDSSKLCERARIALNAHDEPE